MAFICSVDAAYAKRYRARMANLSVPVSIRIDRDAHDLAHALAKAQRRSLKDVILIALQEAAKKEPNLRGGKA